MKSIIVIGRQTGSGGRELGRRLAKRFSIPYYDKELLSETARRLGMRADLLEGADERPPSALHSLLSASMGSHTWLTTGALHSDSIYQMQSDVIRAIIQEGACVIVGRTADYIARERPEMVSIFLHADPDTRAANVAKRTPELDTPELPEKLRRSDIKRRDYYNYFTGRNWGEAANYHLSISSSKLSMDEIEAVVAAYVEAREKLIS